MACRKYKYKEKIVLHLYGELGENDAKDLKAHIEECSECSEEFAYTKKVFQVLDETKTEDIPDANWEKCWNTIDVGIQGKERKKKSILLFPRWAYASAALLIVFTVGFFFGRLAFFQPGKSNPLQLEGSQSAMYPSIQEHFESLKPVLVEYANYTASPDDGKITIDKKIVQSLIIQNILLKRMIADEDPSLKEILEDVDLVLREIANQEGDDADALAMIKELIHKRGILYELEVSKTI
ncbi:MAG: zf-HC2 domain-containing protein [Candidatus Aminicenantes bacterium]|nr:MAG: zf-HC2 domain-containing protein [Candidatus Aminicenantes bacterium]